MKKVKLEPDYQHFAAPHPAIVVGTFVNEKPTYNTLSNFGMTCGYPLHVYVSSVKSHYTNIGIRKHKTFSVNVPSPDNIVETDYVGRISGHQVDKSEVFEYFTGDLKTAPLIKSFRINFECKVIQTIDVGRNEMFIAKVVAVYCDNECMDGNRIDIEKVNPLSMYMDMYYRDMGKPYGKAYEVGKKYKPKL
ncbi:MAG: flavin reductase family protein [Promethearchaeota archaeon]|nr:MAG: flavin reductase family protein [Candidatus Lokiarchaeota archaeon]